MDKKQTTATCPKCGEEIVQCENCENMGLSLIHIGCGSCALFADEDDEGQGWCELHQESVCFIDKCSDRISKV